MNYNGFLQILFILSIIHNFNCIKLDKKSRKQNCEEETTKRLKKYNSQLKILDSSIKLFVGDIIHCEIIIEDISEIDRPIVTMETKVINTPDNEQYQYFPIIRDESCFMFKIRSKKNAWISLNTMPIKAEPMMEFILGCCDNITSSVNSSKILIKQTNLDGTQNDIPVIIKITSDDLQVAAANADGAAVQQQIQTNIPLNETEFISYWISWYDSVYKIGRQGDIKPMIILKPENFNLTVNFIGIRTMDNTGVWILEDPKCPSKPTKLPSDIPPVLGTKCWTPDVTATGEIFSSEEL
ncbi:uncharacterized protein LOC129618623 [Condylostylus longicornis]|uniref:uncharacterized protein LOC129618623 n=1 Tax=Condylostylus longicornis TaxID=2530218 RepID=UPI00244E549C|nr:uncharacterized protein LOC129618623 [Condylostylus longicornis]